MKKLYKKLSGLQKKAFWIVFIGLFVFGSTQINMSQVNGLLTALGLRIETVSSTTALVSYNGYSSTVNVSDSLQGGLFNYVSSVVTVDNGIVFPATGKGSGYWVRQFDKSKGVSVDWWGLRNEAGVRLASAGAGQYGIINFTPNRTYVQRGRIIPNYVNQTFNGNNATLYRANDSIVTLTSVANITDNSITVTGIPSNWSASNGYIYLFTDTTEFSSSTTLSISSISGNTVTFTSAIGGLYDPNTLHPQITSWPVGTKVLLSYTQLDDGGYRTNFSVNNLIFDGNRANNSYNYSWRINPAIHLQGNAGQQIISNSTFINMPNENIVGHGIKVVNNTAFNLNGSFVHLSANYNYSPDQIPSIISGNVTDSTNRINDTIIGHSEGVITFSNTSGYANIVNNRFKHGANAILGFIQSGTDAGNGGVRNLLVADNYAEDFHKIFYNTNLSDPTGLLYKYGHISVHGNMFNKCDTTDWTAFQANLNKSDTLDIGPNTLVGGTVWIVPVLNSDSLQRYVLNNSTATPQKAGINVTGNISGAIITSNGVALVPPPRLQTGAISFGNGTNIPASDSTSLNFYNYVGGSYTYNNMGIGQPGNINYSISALSYFPSFKQTVVRPAGGAAISLLDVFGRSLTTGVENRVGQIGALVSIGDASSSATYLYIGANALTTYSAYNNIRFYADGTTYLMNVPDAVGDFMTIPHGGGKATARTAAEVLGDIGAETKHVRAKATLVAGTKAVTISGVTTSSTAIVSLVSVGGTVTTTWNYTVVCTANTVTITALTNTGTTDTSDTSTLTYDVAF